MTFVQLQTLVSSWLDDSSNGYFTLTEVKRWLNNAQREAQKMVGQAFEGHYRKVVQTTMVQYQREYQLPSDFRKLSRLEVILTGSSFQTESVQRLVKITENQQDNFERTGTPLAYYFKGDQIVLVPAPDDDKTLRLTYMYRVTDMSNDADTPDIPEDYHEYLAVLATLDGLYKDGRETGPMMQKKEYFEKLFKQDAEERNVDESRTVVQTQFDDEWD